MTTRFSTICKRSGSSWYGKRTAGIYDTNGAKVAIIPAFPYRTLDEAKRLSEKIASILNGRNNCNGGDCERAKLCAEPCADCLYCDERGNL